MTTIAADTDADAMAAGDGPSGVLTKLESTRQEWLRFERWLALARILLAEMAMGAVFIMADWTWVLPTAARALGLVAMAGLAVYLVVRFRRPLDRTGSAVRVEAHFPDLGQRLRTVVEYAQPAPDTVPASPGLLRALNRDTQRRVAGLDFRALIPWAAFERRAVLLFFATAVGLVILLVNPGLRTAALRMLLLPAHYTSLTVQPGDLTLKAGDELKLDATVSGRPVSSASWSYRRKDGGDRWITASLAPAATPGQPRQSLIGTLTASLKDCQTDVEYRVVAGEVESPTFHVKVVHPVVLKSLEATITPPAYTRRPPEVVKQGNFRAVEGSRVRLKVTLDHAPRNAKVLLGTPADSSQSPIPLQIEGATLTAELPPVTKETAYQIDAIDDEGMKLENAESYRIKVQLDGAPKIRFVQPEESLAVTPTTEVPIQVEATDDFGVSQLAIRYKVGDGPDETLHQAQFEKQPVTAQGLATLYLEKHKLSFADAITYYAFVDDNYPPQAHRAQTELRFIDILPYKQEYQLVEGGGTCSGSVTLEELIARQRVNVNRTFALERERAVDDATARRLARFEEELAAATAEFAAGISAIAGPMPALDAAAAAMKSATALLAAKNLAAARPREEEALKELISVRQNLRKLLKQSSSSQSSACRQFDVKQLQKIRRPPADQTKKQLAKLENDLHELAKREQKFSEEIEANGRGGPQLEPREQPEQPTPESQKPANKPPSKPSGTSSPVGKPSPDSRSKDRLAEEQRQAAGEAERLRQLARQDEALTDLTNRRLEAASQAVEQAARTAESGRTEQAAREARAAARKLESTARQVGALKARELADRLARQRDLAQAIARAERELAQALRREPAQGENGANSQERLAGTQTELADEVAALADVLKQLRIAAQEEQPELAQTIGQAAQANPPEDVENAMRQNVAAITSGERVAAAREADNASQRLDALALDLESARKGAVQPQLDRLLAAEKSAAELQQRLRSVRQSAQQAEAEKAVSDLAQSLQKLAPGDGPLQQAADNLSAATQTGGGWTHADKIEPGQIGYFVPPVRYTAGVDSAILALQAKIQEIMLDNALVERNGPVPPQYRSLVDDYYRVLSEDLR